MKIILQHENNDGISDGICQFNEGDTINILSDTSIRNTKPKETQYKLMDGNGLYLYITPKGQKYWRMNYRFAEWSEIDTIKTIWKIPAEK